MCTQGQIKHMWDSCFALVGLMSPVNAQRGRAGAHVGLTCWICKDYIRIEHKGTGKAPMWGSCGGHVTPVLKGTGQAHMWGSCGAPARICVTSEYRGQCRRTCGLMWGLFPMSVHKGTGEVHMWGSHGAHVGLTLRVCAERDRAGAHVGSCGAHAGLMSPGMHKGPGRITCGPHTSGFHHCENRVSMYVGNNHDNNDCTFQDQSLRVDLDHILNKFFPKSCLLFTKAKNRQMSSLSRVV